MAQHGRTRAGKQVGEAFTRSAIPGRMRRSDRARFFRDNPHRLCSIGRPDACCCNRCIRREMNAAGLEIDG